MPAHYLDGFTHPAQKPRFTSIKLERTSRPSYRFEFWVTGRGLFPFDMLRHDRCWPVDDPMALYYPGIHGNPRSIKMRSHSEPTVDRWSSFGWTVSEHDLRL